VSKTNIPVTVILCAALSACMTGIPATDDLFTMTQSPSADAPEKGAGSKAAADGKGTPVTAETGTGSSARNTAIQRPASPPVPLANSDETVINGAISTGDCGTLSGYVNRGRENTDRKLYAAAATALGRYTSYDTGTPKYRTNRMDSRIRRTPKDLMEKVFITPETALPEVTAALVAGVSDQYLKVKIIHDWICDNIAYDTEMYLSGRIVNQDYAAVLRKKTGVCSGYAGVFNEMCRLANIQSIGIQGYSKGFGYRGSIDRDTDHEWNAVKINGKWYLVDVTWDAGYVDKKTFVKSYSTSYLFQDSRPFLYSHLPAKDQYQFYAPLLDAAGFVREPYINGKFFQYGLDLAADKPSYQNGIDGVFSFDIVLRNANVTVSSNLRFNNQNIEGASWAERKGSVVNVSFDVPDKREYKGHVFARLRNEENYLDAVGVSEFETVWAPGVETLFKEKKISSLEYDLFQDAYFKVADNGKYYFKEDQFNSPRNKAVKKIHSLLDLSSLWMDSVFFFNINAVQGYDGFGNEKKYPHAFISYRDAAGTELLSPVKGILKAGSDELFSIKSRDYTKFALIINGEYLYFNKKPSGNYELSIKIPSDIKELNIYGSKNGQKYTGLIQYDVVSY
jgi:hypothetical protein